MIQLFLQPGVDVALKQASEVSVTNAIGYSLTVLVISIACYVFYTLYKGEKDLNNKRHDEMVKHSEAVLTVITAVRTRLEDTKEHGDILKENKGILNNITKLLEEIKGRLK